MAQNSKPRNRAVCLWKFDIDKRRGKEDSSRNKTGKKQNKTVVHIYKDKLVVL